MSIMIFQRCCRSLLQYPHTVSATTCQDTVLFLDVCAPEKQQLHSTLSPDYFLYLYDRSSVCYCSQLICASMTQHYRTQPVCFALTVSLLFKRPHRFSHVKAVKALSFTKFPPSPYGPIICLEIPLFVILQHRVVHLW